MPELTLHYDPARHAVEAVLCEQEGEKVLAAYTVGTPSPPKLFVASPAGTEQAGGHFYVAFASMDWGSPCIPLPELDGYHVTGNHAGINGASFPLQAREK